MTTDGFKKKQTADEAKFALDQDRKSAARVAGVKAFAAIISQRTRKSPDEAKAFSDQLVDICFVNDSDLKKTIARAQTELQQATGTQMSEDELRKMLNDKIDEAQRATGVAKTVVRKPS